MIPAKDIYFVRVLRAVTSIFYEIQHVFWGPKNMAILYLTNGNVDRTIDLESAQKLVVFMMATCPKSTASSGAIIDDLSEIQCVFGGPDDMAILLISPIELWIEQLS
jgi:hypothetical protein